MKISGLGEVTKDERFGWYYSEPIQLSVLAGHECKIVLAGYDEEPFKEDYHAVIGNFLSSTFSVLREVETHIYQYYLDMNSYWSSTDDEFLSIKSPSEIWSYIQLGSEPIVSRRSYGDKKVYVSLECNCDWEPEHGLQIVFKEGVKVCKVGPYDGHVTNSDAYDDESLENTIYRGLA